MNLTAILYSIAMKGTGKTNNHTKKRKTKEKLSFKTRVLDVLAFIRGNSKLVIGGLLLLIIAFYAIFAPWIAIIVVIINLLTDIAYAVIDPRIRYS